MTCSLQSPNFTRMSLSTNPPDRLPDLSTLSSKDRFSLIGSWFLGPRAKNADILSEMVKLVAKKIQTDRKRYFPKDPMHSLYSRLIMVTNCAAFRCVSAITWNVIGTFNPFYSPWYAAPWHMTGEIVTFPSTLGYMMAMFYNQLPEQRCSRRWPSYYWSRVRCLPGVM